MSYSTFKQEWNGRRIDYDNVYAYQCVDLILQYVKQEFGLPTGVWGNAIDYWKKPTATLLTKFDLKSTTDVKQGDIVVLNGLAGNPFGHIGIAESQTSTTVRLLEQNGAGGANGTGKDAIGIHRDIAKTRIAGVLRAKVAAAPAPAPKPPTARSTVFLPSSVRSWRLYHVNSGLRPNTKDQKAVLAPHQFPPGITYKIEAWVGDYAVVVTTQMFGRGVLWVKGTDAVIK